MDRNKDDGLVNAMLYSGAMSMSNSHVSRHGLPVREPFGVPFHFDPSYWDQAYSRYSGSFSYLPFSGYVGVYDYSFEPAFIRKRNERERQRVRCVNEGYARLREHLPKELADKRLSKVETLRAAINYIKHLQSLLECQPLGSTTKEKMSTKEATDASSPELRRDCNSDGESKTSLSSSPYGEFEETCI
uniref:BHLH domain-containing protein n=1 Tax=Pelusios castaneus TaxID=367368 RepID=A0A8C8SC93_9SAUR